MALQVERSYWIDNLRSFITLLVVAHHSALAYTTFSYFDQNTYINSTHPIVDLNRWFPLDVFANFNDIFFMPLMFLISGLFFFKAFKNKGRSKFLSERIKRLGFVFIFFELFIIPFAYIPSYYLVNHQFQIKNFIIDYFQHQQWPVGPPWFIWLLLLFNFVGVFFSQRFYLAGGHLLIRLFKTPFWFLLIFLTFAALMLIPLSLHIGQYTWTGFGPFDFQLNRVLFYFLFFLTGCIMGSVQWEEELFHSGKLLGCGLSFWVAISLFFFATTEVFTFKGFGMMSTLGINPTIANLIFMLLFVISAILISLTCLYLFKANFNRSSFAWGSLSKSAYGIYLFHYVFVTWLQFLCINVKIHAGLKFLLVFSLSTALSWFLVALLKKIKFISLVI